MQIFNLYQRYFILVCVTMCLFLDKASSATLEERTNVDRTNSKLSRFERDSDRFTNRRDIAYYEGIQDSAYGPNGASLALAANAHDLEEETRRMKNKY